MLAIAEDEGAARAAYALKLLQSDGRLAIAAAGKDPDTGQLVTRTNTVTGPAAIVLTTTSAQVDEELLNRCLVLAADEDRHQTRAIHAAQRRARAVDMRLGHPADIRLTVDGKNRCRQARRRRSRCASGVMATPPRPDSGQRKTRQPPETARSSRQSRTGSPRMAINLQADRWTA